MQPGDRRREARDDAALAHEHLSEAGAIETKVGGATPSVGDAEEFLGYGDGLADRERSEIGADVAALNESLRAVGELDLEPAFIFVDSAGQNFEATLPRNGEERSVLGDVGLAVDVGAELRNTNDGGRCGGVRFAISNLRRLEEGIQRL